MTFSEAVSDGFRNYTNFTGRLVRSGYWWWILFSSLAGLVAQIIDLAAGTGPLLNAVVALALFLPGLSVLIRRLHDVDRSGWTWLWSLTIIGILYVLYLLIKPGTEGGNRFGPDPRLGEPQPREATA